ncbi:MAG: LEA type 2 family protein [Acidobacteriota bacterium]
MFRLAAALLFATASPLGLEVDPGAQTLAATIRVAAAQAAAGDFQGRVSLYGSRAEIPIAAVRISKAGAPLALRATIRYADIPADWVGRFRPDGFEYVMKGTVGTTPVEWTGRMAWEEVAVAGDDAIIAKFVGVDRVDLTVVQPSGSRGVVRLHITNPFAFPVEIARSVYRIEADGYPVGRGSAPGVVLKRGTSRLEFPIDMDHSQLIAAAGRAFLAGGSVEARLKGEMTVRVAGHDLRVPLDVAGQVEAGSLRSAPE